MCKHSYFLCWLSYYQCNSTEKWTINGHYYILRYHGNVWHQKNLIFTRPHEFRWCILDGQTNLSLTATVTFDSSSIFLALQNSQFLTIFSMHWALWCMLLWTWSYRSGKLGPLSKALLSSKLILMSMPPPHLHNFISKGSDTDLQDDGNRCKLTKVHWPNI